MEVPFVSFCPMEQELNSALRVAFDRSWYIEGEADESFKKHLSIIAV